MQAWLSTLFDFSSGQVLPSGRAKAEQAPVSAWDARASWLAWRFPPRVTLGFRGSRIFSHARARRRMTGDAERDARTVFFQNEASA